MQIAWPEVKRQTNGAVFCSLSACMHLMQSDAPCMHHCMFIFVFDVGVRIECLHAFDSIGCRVCAAQPSEKHNFVRVYKRCERGCNCVCNLGRSRRPSTFNQFPLWHPAGDGNSFSSASQRKNVSHHAVSLFCTLLAQKKRLL